jgi:hypothetical protein
MPYCITLRSDERITGWYDGSNSRWSTNHRRQKLFDKKRDAKPVRHELCKLCPRIADVINIEPSNGARGARDGDYSPPYGEGKERNSAEKSPVRPIRILAVRGDR